MNWKMFALTLFYSSFCFFNIAYLSYFKEEQYIDGDEIKTLCDAYKTFVVDDIRSFTAPLTLLLIAPLLWLCWRNKQRTLYLPLFTLLLIAFWYWRFFGRLHGC